MESSEVFKLIESKYPDALKSTDLEGTEQSVTIDVNSIADVCNYLKSESELQFDLPPILGPLVMLHIRP